MLAKGAALCQKYLSSESLFRWKYFVLKLVSSELYGQIVFGSYNLDGAGVSVRGQSFR